jgi:hypothetical protein
LVGEAIQGALVEQIIIKGKRGEKREKASRRKKRKR